MPLLPPSVDNDTGKQRVSLLDIDPNTTTAGKQRVFPTIKPPTMNPKRQRLVNQYIDLTTKETNNLNKKIVNKLGMKFLDNKDPEDFVCGLITKIVKHKKSNMLQFQYYDDSAFTEIPTNKNNF